MKSPIFDSLTGQKSRAPKLKALPSATRWRNCSILKPLTSASNLHRQGFSELAVKVAMIHEPFNTDQYGYIPHSISACIIFSCTFRLGDMCQGLSQAGAVEGVFKAAKNPVDGVRAAWKFSGCVRENLRWHLATELRCQQPVDAQCQIFGRENVHKLQQLHNTSYLVFSDGANFLGFDRSSFYAIIGRSTFWFFTQPKCAHFHF